jgi:hypothetical protein
MLMVTFMSYHIEELAEIKPLPANVIPDESPVRGCDPKSSKFKALWMPDQVRHDDFGF